MRNETGTAENSGTSRRQGVQAIARAGAVLRALEQAPGGLALGELAAATRLPKSTAHRIVAALAEEDLVDQADHGRVRLGSGIVRLAAARREALGERLRPLLLDLRRELDETVDLAVLDGSSARFVDQAPAPRRLRAVSAIGEAFPLHCTANGKSLLSALPERGAVALLPERLSRFTPNTIVSRKKLMIELEGVRQNGVAFDREEHTEGICAVGVVVSDGVDPTAAAISMPVPTQRFHDREHRIVEALRQAAGEANELLASA